MNVTELAETLGKALSETKEYKEFIQNKEIVKYSEFMHKKGKINKEGIRKMTPREWARLQGFPDSFIIPVADASAYKQFGNSVAVPAIQATAEQIIKRICSKRK